MKQFKCCWKFLIIWEPKRFHVDNLSSAHVYLRLPDGVTIDTIPPAVLEDCSQLTKENSIKGCKEASVSVVYTPWENLSKNETTMDIGQVGFKKDKAVKKITVTKKNPVITRLNRTKVEKYPNLQGKIISILDNFFSSINSSIWKSRKIWIWC